MENIEKNFDYFPIFDVQSDVDDNHKQKTLINLYEKTIESMEEINRQVYTEMGGGGRMSSNKKKSKQKTRKNKKKKSWR